MRQRHHLLAPLVVSLLTLPAAQADGLSDLKAALSRLQGQTPLKATVDIKTWRKQGDGKDSDEQQGAVNLGIEDNGRGLQVIYGKEVLSRTDAEQQARIKDKKAKTPTLTAVRELDFAELKAMTSAAASLARQIDDAIFKGETADTYNGKPARKLAFTSSIDKLPERDRKYIKEFNSQLDVWIAADGTPLATRRSMKSSGRAFVVVSFESNSDLERVYTVAGDRLVLVRDEEKGSSSGAGEKQVYKTSMSLQVL
ncbi:hypothetical protein [Chitinimonas sp. BJYL2]|uniref:hypothetical protein n=1 Tax=Chitinimonas sp. BJYL2 TaxID=2976696 RepID=UPI0022B3FB8B|nr:hypothetical protein [Chitinimonas sp. BJYL2]